MKVEFHPAVQTDFDAAVDYYEAQGGPHLADRFEAEFRSCVAAIKIGPTQFAFYRKSDRFRRIRFENFPFVLVYREIPGGVRVSVLKHERRHPRFGLARH